MNRKLMRIGDVYLNPDNIVSFGLEKDQNGERYLFVNVIYDDGKETDRFVFYRDTVRLDDTFEEIADVCSRRTSSQNLYDKNIRDFGAVGDGITDDTEALQKAIAFEGTVFFPSGTYLLKSQLYTNGSVRWIGTGDTSVVKLIPGDTSNYHEDSRKEAQGRWVYDTRMIFTEHGKHLEIRNMKLDANKEAFDKDTNGFSKYDYTNCLEIRGAERVILENVTIRGGLIEGAYIQKTPDIRLTGCRFIENGFPKEDAAGVQIDGSEITSAPSIIISDCEFNSNGFNGLELTSVYGAVMNNITCRHNSFDGVALWGGCNHCVLSNIFTEDNRGGINLRRNHSSNLLDRKQAHENSFCTDIIINGLVTSGNRYGILWGCAQNIFIHGWVGMDQYSHALCYLHPDEDITGEIRSAHLLARAGDICNPDDASDPTKFKVKLI